MARNKINFAAQGLYVGPSPATGLHFDGTGCGTLSGTQGETLVNELYRIQGVDYSFNFDKENVAAFGDLAPIDYASTTSPTVNLNFNYLVSNFINEKNIGFTISSGQLVNALSGIIQTEEDRNYFLAIHGVDGEDLHNNPNYNYNSNGNIIGFGNGVINNYSFNVAVGQFPTVSVGVEALNIVAYDKQSSLFTTLVDNAGENGNFDIVNTGEGAFSNNRFQDWDILSNESALVKIVPDPVNISNAINQDLMIINRTSGNAYFTSSTTGATDWAASPNNPISGYVFINTGNNTLVMRKTTPSAFVYFPLANQGLIYPMSSGTWYKFNVNVNSMSQAGAYLFIGGYGQAVINPLVTGVNEKFIYLDSGSFASFGLGSSAATGDIVLNSVELSIPQNYSARFYSTGSAGVSYNYLSKPTNNNLYSYLNSSVTLNKRFNVSFDIKYSGFNSTGYSGPTRNPLYFRFGQADNNSFAGARFPTLDSSYSGQFNKLNLEFSNSTTLDGSTAIDKNIYLVRNFNSLDCEVWVDNLKVEETNKTDIINGNLFNGSFEVYHPSSINSGAGTINIFSGWLINQNGASTPYVYLTGSSSIPSYDNTKTTSNRSLNAQITNATGASNYLVLYPYINTFVRYVGNKRHNFSCYAKYSGSSSFVMSLTEVGDNQDYYVTSIANNNTWQRIDVDFIPTGNTQIKLETTFGNTTGDQIWLDDINLYYYDDCYELPVVQDVSGGFGLPINPTTNYSGLSTNNNLKSLSVLNPKDAYLTINYNDLGVNVTGWKLQSVNLDLPLNREKIYQIDQRHPDYRLLFPIVGNITINAITDNLVTGNLYNYYFDCNKNYDLSFGIDSPCNSGHGINFIVKKAKLNGLSFNNNVNGLGQDVTMDFIYTIPSPSATGQGLFMSGITDLS